MYWTIQNSYKPAFLTVVCLLIQPGGGINGGFQRLLGSTLGTVLLASIS